jgi:hypothetical protein
MAGEMSGCVGGRRVDGRVDVIIKWSYMGEGKDT